MPVSVVPFLLRDTVAVMSYACVSRFRSAMLCVLSLLVLCGGTGAVASPPLDNSPGPWAGEWSGAGPLNAFCMVKLDPDGTGHMMLNGGHGDWRGARIRWVNRQQSVHVLASEPWASRPRQRTGPLTDAQLQSGLNLALALRWGAGGASVCHLQRTEDQARRSELARGVLIDLNKRDTP